MRHRHPEEDEEGIKEEEETHPVVIQYLPYVGTPKISRSRTYNSYSD